MTYIPPDFIADTVKTTGHSPESIRRGVWIGENIIPELRETLRSHPLGEREPDLLYLCFMTSAEQLEVLRLLRETAAGPSTLSAILEAAGQDSSLPTRIELEQGIWANTSNAERAEFFPWLNRHRED